jgi:hypothetical protein
MPSEEKLRHNFNFTISNNNMAGERTLEAGATLAGYLYVVQFRIVTEPGGGGGGNVIFVKAIFF